MPKSIDTPPFRADHVGSLLRPKPLQEARAAWKAGTLPPAALREVEDRCITAAIARQQDIGLRAATDGEYSRAYWHYDFVAGLDGVELSKSLNKRSSSRAARRLATPCASMAGLAGQSRS